MEWSIGCGGACKEILRYLGVSHFVINFRPSDCELGDLISTRHHYVCILPLLWPCTLCRSLDALHSKLWF